MCYILVIHIYIPETTIYDEFPISFDDEKAFIWKESKMITFR